MNMVKSSIFVILCIMIVSHELLSQDKIIKIDGIIIHADVIEVGFDVIRYKKSTYPEGPVFSLYRSEVYAIAYADNTTDYFTLTGFASANQPVEPGGVDQVSGDEPEIGGEMEAMPAIDFFSGKDFLKTMQFSLGMGAIQTYSKAEEGIEGIDKKFSFPAVSVRVWGDIKDNIQAGAQITWGKLKFQNDDYNDYDGVVTVSDINENVFSWNVFARYLFRGEKVHPYGLLGIGIARSAIHTQRDLSFLEDGASFRINSYAQTRNLSILLRGGAAVDALEKIKIYADLGSGVSLFQLGVQFDLNVENL